MWLKLCNIRVKVREMTLLLSFLGAKEWNQFSLLMNEVCGMSWKLCDATDYKSKGNDIITVIPLYRGMKSIPVIEEWQ